MSVYSVIPPLFDPIDPEIRSILKPATDKEITDSIICFAKIYPKAAIETLKKHREKKYNQLTNESKQKFHILFARVYLTLGNYEAAKAECYQGLNISKADSKMKCELQILCDISYFFPTQDAFKFLAYAGERKIASENSSCQ